MAIIKKNVTFRKNKKSKMLFLFLALSFFLWILIKLSNEYTDVVQFQVDFVNLPKGKMQKEKSTRLNVTVKTFGFNLIKYHLNKRKLAVDLKEIKHKKGMQYYQLSNELLPQLQEQISSEIEVIDIHPDTLYFNLAIKKSKEVPIVSDIEIQYKSGYNLLDNLKLEPSFVTISGTQKSIDSIKEVKTKHEVLEEVTSLIKLTVPLETTALVTYSNAEVLITGKVEKITEVKLKLPFTIVNLPDDYSISTIPDQVDVIFLVGVSDYKTINQNDFKIRCDYNKSVKEGLNYLIPKVVSKPSKVSKVKIVPSKIEYFIKK